MTVATHTLHSAEPLSVLRHLRSTQAWTLAIVAMASIAIGLVLILIRGEDGVSVVRHAIGWQFAIWGVIDLGFAGMGIAQSVKVSRTPPCPQAEADEFLGAEKLLRTLRLNHQFNTIYVLIGVALLVWAGLAHSPALLGHGAGVLIQGGFLFVFDLAYTHRFERLMYAPVE
ncbi:MAG: hypothetical protein JWM57_4300 [Phycisphaerales bacterium]|nr:hypothetical protein [Phycisphaerales bacterium]